MSQQKQKEEATISVPSKDGKQEKDDDEKKNAAKTDNALAGIDEPKDPVKKGKDTSEDELSAEDAALKARLDELVNAIIDSDYANVAKPALNLLKSEIRSATGSMTAVPKPLKFLKVHYENIKQFYSQSIATDKGSAACIDYADLMSVLAMTMEEPRTRRCLKYRLDSDIAAMSEWGSQYLKHLAAEIRIEMERRLDAENDPEKTADLADEALILRAVDVIVEFYMANNAEADAIDLLLEVERKELILARCKEENHERVCDYLRSCASFLPPPDDLQIYRICFDLYLKFKNYYHAMRFALKLDNKKLVRQVMRSLQKRPLMKRQCAYLLGWHQYMGYDEDEEEELSENELAEYPVLESAHDIEDYEVKFAKRLNGELVEDDGDDAAAKSGGKKDGDKVEVDADADDEDEDIADVNDLIGNHGLSEAFHSLARDLDVLDPKDPESDIFKEQFEGAASTNGTLGGNTTEVISARKSLAITYVNAFVNCGYGRDKFMMSGGSNNSDTTSIATANDWIAKNKERGQLAAVASIGNIMLWDEEAANCVDRYFESTQAHIRAGAYLAIGISCSGMKSESGMGLALLSAPALNEEGKRQKIERLCSILGLGLSYAGQAEAASEVYETLEQLISTEESDEVSSLAALCLGYNYVGTCNAEICNIILADLMERAEVSAATLNNPLFLLNVLGLGLLFLGKQEEVDVTLEAMDVFTELNPKFAQSTKVCLECLAYAGTGNVLKIQQMLGIIGEHFDDEFEDSKKGEEKEEKKAAAAEEDEDEADDKKNKDDDYRYYQSIATLGISIIALGEELGTTMCLRMYMHLIQYGNIRVKRAVPLALAMISVSNPLLEISDTLSKLSHDHDEYVSRNAILALGIIGAGTNNARIARMLRQLTEYYGTQKEADHLYMIRIAQGLIHLGKGLLTVKCFHSDRFLLNKVSLCGILTVLFTNIGTKFPPKQDPSATEKLTPSWSGNTISLFGDFHYLLYALNLCIKPRMLITLDDKKLKPLATTVRVGQAVDTVGAAGKNPKRITGFQTHETPILLQYNDRAELATDKYVSSASVLEGFAVLRLNPESEQERKKKRRKQKESAAEAAKQ